MRKPPHPPSTTPPCSQQKRKNSQDPVRHWAWSPTKSLSCWGRGRRLRVGRVKKKRSLLVHESGLGPELKSSLLTRGDGCGKYSLKISSEGWSSLKKSSNPSPPLLASSPRKPCPMLSRRSWLFRTLKPRSKDKSFWVRSFDRTGNWSRGSNNVVWGSLMGLRVEDSGRVVWGRVVWGRVVWERVVWGRVVWGRVVWGRLVRGGSGPEQETRVR